MHVWVHMYMYAYACEAQKLASCVFFNCNLHYDFTLCISVCMAGMIACMWTCMHMRVHMWVEDRGWHQVSQLPFTLFTEAGTFTANLASLVRHLIPGNPPSLPFQMLELQAGFHLAFIAVYVSEQSKYFIHRATSLAHTTLCFEAGSLTQSRTH